MRNWIMGFIGLSSGFAVASALFALITTIGVLSRLVQVTRTANRIHWYEVCFMAGGILGNVAYLYEWPLTFGFYPAVGFMGIFFGIYTGCFIGALTEVVNVFPILFHRFRLRQGMKALIWSLAVGKVAGGIIHLLNQ